MNDARVNSYYIPDPIVDEKIKIENVTFYNVYEGIIYIYSIALPLEILHKNFTLKKLQNIHFMNISKMNLLFVLPMVMVLAILILESSLNITWH